jgi:hypothetical protein
MNIVKKFTKKLKLQSHSDLYPLPPPQKEGASDFEQQVAPPPTLDFRTEISDGSLSTFFMEYQMTVQPTIRLTQKEASMLLMMEVVKATALGVDIASYFVMEWLFNYLTRYNSEDPVDYKIEKGRQTLLLAHLILLVVRGSWLNFVDREELPEEVVKDIASTGWLPSEQTLSSWKSTYDVQKYFVGRAVRLDSFQERETNSQRYSGYCKGYGEGGHLARKQKTPFSSELDGDFTVRDDWEFSLLETQQYSQIFLTIERWKKKQKTNDEVEI